MELNHRIEDIPYLMRFEIRVFVAIRNGELNMSEIQEHAEKLLKWKPHADTIEHLLKPDRQALVDKINESKEIRINHGLFLAIYLFKSGLMLGLKSEVPLSDQSELSFVLLEYLLFHVIKKEPNYVNEEWVLALVLRVANKYNLPVPSSRVEFLRELEKKYYFANWVGQYYRGKITYNQMREELEGLFRSLYF